MMSLNIQFLSLVVSFLYGFFMFVLMEINYKLIACSSLIWKIVVSFLFVLVNTLLYFFILLKINNGYVHLYFIVYIILGYFLCKVIYKWFVNVFYLWYTKINNK